MTLVAGTLGDLDLATLAEVTSLGRSSLRLDLREASGRLIGSLVFKAGRVVSASAGTKHGHDALRVLLRSTRDTRFELAREPLDYALSSSLASIEELGGLLRSSAPRPSPAPASRPSQPPAVTADGSQDSRAPGGPAARPSQPPAASTDVSRNQPPVATAAGSSRAKHRRRKSPSTSQLPTLRSMRAANGPLPVSRTSRAAARAARAQPGTHTERTPLARGKLDQFDLITLLQTISLGRQLVDIEVHDGGGAAVGRVRVKSGKIVGAEAGDASGVTALAELLGSTRGVGFAAFRVTGSSDPLRTLASVSEIGRRLARGTGELTDRAILQGTLAQFDIATLLRTIGSGRQHCAIEIHDGQTAAGRIVVKSGLVLSATAGALGGLRAIEHLISAHRTAQFRVIRLAGELPTDAPIGRISRVLLDLERLRVNPLDPTVAIEHVVQARASQALHRLAAAPPPASSRPPATAAERESPTRILRWVIPLSAFIGGATVFLLFRGAAMLPRPPVSEPPAALAPSPPVVEPPAPAAEPGSADELPVFPLLPASAADPPTDPPTPADDPDPPGPPELSLRAAQAALDQLGYGPGPIDSAYGRLTRQAIQRFQRAEKLRATGQLDAATRRALIARLAK